MTRRRPEDLPDYRKPPLTETVLSLQFDPVGGMTAAHIGLLWERFRDRLPVVEEHPPLAPVIEKFEAPSPPKAEITVEKRPPIPRLWFLNQEKTELVQVQTDRFIHNWRKMEGLDPYPRYEPIRNRFRDEVAVLEQFLVGEGLGRPVVNQCEVTYVNHIEPCGVWERHGQWDRVFPACRSLPKEAFLPEGEDAGFRTRFVIRNDAGEAVGRLHVAVEPAWKRSDNTPLFTMHLTARGAPRGNDMAGAFDFFDLGRLWIVNGFADLTTREMQQIWERTDG